MICIIITSTFVRSHYSSYLYDANKPTKISVCGVFCLQLHVHTNIGHAHRQAVEANSSPRYRRKFYGAHFMRWFSASFELIFYPVNCKVLRAQIPEECAQLRGNIDLHN